MIEETISRHDLGLDPTFTRLVDRLRRQAAEEPHREIRFTLTVRPEPKGDERTA
jgi:hypothetical protein